jgi:photosystem II PsbJ protein
LFWEFYFPVTFSTNFKTMSKLKGPDGRIPDRLPDGRPAVAWERRWTEGTLPLWLVATAGGIAVIFVLGIFFYGSYNGVGSA